ncbi:MAG: DUF4405 domain-containing protein [Holophaga sp.]|nr:DUF4405 domain-containing protein [Holophaga sp.]
MKLRKITSLTALLSFAVLVTSGVVLFLTPQGRVAYWSEWHLWGLTKEAWGSMHILLSLLFLVAGIVHIVLNWRPIVLYLRDRKERRRVVTPEFAASAVLTILFTVGPLLGWPPFRWVMDLNSYAKDQGSRTYGEPPYGHAEQSSLQAFAQKTGMDLEKAQTLLKGRGIAFEGPQQRLQDIAKRNHLTPQQVYLAMKDAQINQVTKGQLPEEVAPGLGRKTLEDLCKEYNLELARVRTILEARNVIVKTDQPFRALAEANGTGPHELYAVIRDGLK